MQNLVILLRLKTKKSACNQLPLYILTLLKDAYFVWIKYLINTDSKTVFDVHICLDEAFDMLS